MDTGALYSVILAGGSGTRLWPLSRKGNPKFLHALTGSAKSLLQATSSRLGGLTGPSATYVVTGVGHAAAVARQLPDLPDGNLLIEPSPRDSCAAIGLAASLIARRDPDAIMGSFPSDHVVLDEPAFVATIADAIEGARQGALMTVGITPTHPATGYGYLRCGAPWSGAGPVRAVAEFKEKPSREVAEVYVSTGDYLWNAGMFVWRVGAFLAELERQQPSLRSGLAQIAEAWGTPDQDRVLGAVWPTLTKISVDYGVMERAADAGLVATVPGNFGWTDIGDFHAVGEVLSGPDSSVTDEHGNVIVAEPKEAPVLLRDTVRTVVVAQSGRLVATLGLQDSVVVDTPDAVLVCRRDRAQDIKSLVDELAQRAESRFL
jgi:mannose-1-phosphate guanylyltransferase